MMTALFIIFGIFIYLCIGVAIAFYGCWLDKKYIECMHIETSNKFDSYFLWCFLSWPLAIFFIAYLLVNHYHFKVRYEEAWR